MQIFSHQSIVKINISNFYCPFVTGALFHTRSGFPSFLKDIALIEDMPSKHSFTVVVKPPSYYSLIKHSFADSTVYFWSEESI